MSNETSNRKDDHIKITKEENVDMGGAGFEDITLTHNALPEINKNKIDTSCEILGNRLETPLLIDSMTGGSERGEMINRNLAEAAEKHGIGIGVGSQRAGLEDRNLAKTYSVVREVAPTAFVYGNIGAAQLKSYTIEEVEKAVDMIDADAMAIHLNFAQESIQPEGDVDGTNCLESIERVSRDLSVPVMVKETGCGISKKTAKELKKAGVDIINTGGQGGTSWTYIESFRAAASDDFRKAMTGEVFKNWGIPTAASTIYASSVHPCVIASGGVRTGLDIAKSIAIGADASAAAGPFLEPGLKNAEAVSEKIDQMKEELKTAMFVTGSKTIKDLQNKDVKIGGCLGEYIEG